MNPAALGGAIGGGLSLGMSAAQMAMTKRAQQRAQRYQVHNYKHRYQWAVEDMQAAGINPMLAFATGAGQPQPSGGPGAGGFKADDPANSARMGAMLSRELTNRDRDNELKYAQRERENAQEAYYRNAAEVQGYNADEAEARAELAFLQLPSARANAWLWRQPEMRKKIAVDAGLDTAARAKSLLPWWLGGGRRMRPGQGPVKPGQATGRGARPGAHDWARPKPPYRDTRNFPEDML